MNDSECVEYKFQHHEKYFEKMNTDLERKYFSMFSD